LSIVSIPLLVNFSHDFGINAISFADKNNPPALLPSEGAKSGETEKKKYYRVQIGAYSVKANAEAQLAKAKKAGFTDAFIKYD